MYFTLINNKLYDSDIAIYEPEDTDLDFIGGDLVTASVPSPMVYTTNGKKGDKLRDFLDASLPIVSKRFLDLLKEAGVDNLQVFPAVVKSTVDDTVWEDYYGLNVLGLIACASLEESSYSEIMPGHYIFDELAIDAEKANGALMFRLQESSTTIIMHKNVGRHIMLNDPDKLLQGWSVGQIKQ